MLRLTLATGVACGVTLWTPAGAQFNNSPLGPAAMKAASLNGAMPGQVVGSYRGSVKPVGQKLPAAAPQAGLPITSGVPPQPYDPKNPFAAFKGTNIDPKDVLAPLVGPDGNPVTPPDALDKLSDKIKAIWGLAAPAPPRPPWTPGIARRNRERVQMMWRRD